MNENSMCTKLFTWERFRNCFEEKNCWAKSWPIGRKHVEMRFEHTSTRCCDWHSSQSPRQSALSARFDSATVSRVHKSVFSFPEPSPPGKCLTGVGSLEQAISISITTLCSTSIFNGWCRPVLGREDIALYYYLCKIISFASFATTTTNLTIFKWSLA